MTTIIFNNVKSCCIAAGSYDPQVDSLVLNKLAGFFVIFHSDESVIYCSENLSKAYPNITFEKDDKNDIWLVRKAKIPYKELYFAASIGPENVNKSVHHYLGLMNSGYAALAAEKPLLCFKEEKVLLCSNADSIPFDVCLRLIVGLAVNNLYSVEKSLPDFAGTITLGAKWKTQFKPCLPLLLKVLNFSDKGNSENLPSLTRSEFVNVILKAMIKRSYDKAGKTFLLKKEFLDTKDINRTSYSNLFTTIDITPATAGKDIGNFIWSLMESLVDQHYEQIVSRSPFAIMNSKEVEQKLYRSKKITKTVRIPGQVKKGSPNTKTEVITKIVMITKPHQLRYLSDSERVLLEPLGSEIDTVHRDFCKEYLDASDNTDAANIYKKAKHVVQVYNSTSTRLSRLIRARFNQANAVYRNYKNGNELTDKDIRGPTGFANIVSMVKDSYQGDVNLLPLCVTPQIYHGIFEEEITKGDLNVTHKSKITAPNNHQFGGSEDSSDDDEETAESVDDIVTEHSDDNANPTTTTGVDSNAKLTNLQRPGSNSGSADKL